MRKIAVFIIIAAVFWGCEKNGLYPVLIINDSERNVSYVYNGIFDTLNALETKQYEVEAYTQPPRDIVDQYGIASIKMTNRQGELFRFVPAEEFVLTVMNTLPVDITVSAGKYIENNDPTALPRYELSIEKGQKAEAKIYTNKPAFTTMSNFPVIIEWSIVSIESEEEMVVIIR